MNLRLFIFVWVAIMAVAAKYVKVYQKVNVCGTSVRRVHIIFALIAFLPVIYLAAFTRPRYDTVLYMHIYNGFPTSVSGLLSRMSATSEKGWVIFQWVVKRIFNGSETAFRVSLVAIHSIPILFFFRKYSQNFMMSLYLFLACGCHFAWMMNGLRQYVAVCIILLAVPFVLKKKYIPTVLLVLLASTFHTSALIMIPIIFVAQGKAWNKKTVICILGAVVFTYLISQYTGLLDSMVEETQYEGAFEAAREFGDDGVNPIRVLVYAVPAVLSFIGRKSIEQDDDPIINLSVNMSIVTVCLYIVAMTSSGILIGRLPIYTSLFCYILLPYVVNRIFKRNAAYVVNFAMAVLFFAYYLIENGGF